MSTFPPAAHDTHVALETSATYGRFVASHTNGSFVTDAKTSNGGPGIAVNAAELLLSALGSCALGLVHKKAAEIDATISYARVKGYSKRSDADGSRYDFIALSFEIEGVSHELAQQLVDNFTANCPIYNTLLRGGSNIVVQLGR